MACCKVPYAYHVTDILAYDDVPPNWGHLATTKAEDEDFDGPLFELDLNGVFLTTTLRDYGLPTRTVYPREGRIGGYYWRVCVPMKRFNNKRIFKVREDNKNATKQVLLLLADNSYSDLIDDILEYPGVEELTNYYGNDYLHRNQITSDWYTNNFDPEDPYWVNIFVPHRVRLGFDCEWDTVQHY